MINLTTIRDFSCECRIVSRPKSHFRASEGRDLPHLAKNDSVESPLSVANSIPLKNSMSFNEKAGRSWLTEVRDIYLPISGR
jgi:hypothetical protein